MGTASAGPVHQEGATTKGKSSQSIWQSIVDGQRADPALPHQLPVADALAKLLKGQITYPLSR